jgi:DivIVA domain-containing protein
VAPALCGVTCLDIDVIRERRSTNSFGIIQTGTHRDRRDRTTRHHLRASADILNLMQREFGIVMRGYSRRQVDELFARVDAGQVTAAALRDARFDRQIRGYEPHGVDAALHEELRQLGDGGD